MFSSLLSLVLFWALVYLIILIANANHSNFTKSLYIVLLILAYTFISISLMIAGFVSNVVNDVGTNISK